MSIEFRDWEPLLIGEGNAGNRPFSYWVVVGTGRWTEVETGNDLKGKWADWRKETRLDTGICRDTFGKEKMRNDSLIAVSIFSAENIIFWEQWKDRNVGGTENLNPEDGGGNWPHRQVKRPFAVAEDTLRAGESPAAWPLQPGWAVSGTHTARADLRANLGWSYA